ncbi:conserved hypothetical protein [Desulfamplus magnetovallimortis]|uniref:YCII-related domain-containing protein n=1 Tax=Desulfamplus magnetovallimortis TaxID=1246637 RepID=A0A1W1HGL6_9BACT|nr:YciI family protein [Desulfamplus magnetovallimortis]SLM31563.1 conserved hypothetical protein [Desulfamplus magnetovallimortis]
MQFIVTGYDGTDDGALERRMNVREAHLNMASEMHESGKWLYAAAILNDEGKMCGSMIVCDFDSREALESEWLNREPYVTGDVWKTIEIRQAMVAPFCAPGSK